MKPRVEGTTRALAHALMRTDAHTQVEWESSVGFQAGLSILFDLKVVRVRVRVCHIVWAFGCHGDDACTHA
jgi:hypothetical protein